MKATATYSIDQYLDRKKNDKCLSIYELCTLGGGPGSKLAWSFATNRYGAVFSILHTLLSRHIPISSDEEKCSQTPMDKHIQWLKNQVFSQWERIKEDSKKLKLIQDGIALTNVMDIGVNKALYEFLQTMVLFCRRHIRLAFFSLDRDAPNFNKTPDLPHHRYGKRADNITLLKLESRLAYLLYFATLGYTKNQQDNTTLVVATRCESSKSCLPMALEEVKQVLEEETKKHHVDKFIKGWEVVDTHEEESIRNFGEMIENFIRKKYDHKVNMPLRWMILRSFVTSLKIGDSKPIIIDKSYIVEQAKQLKMEEKEVEDFLVTFTDFGSILYMPQCKLLRSIVIVDIWEFAQCLDRLFYPDCNEPYAMYGIISHDFVTKIVGQDNAHKNFMKVLVAFSMAAEIKNSCVVVNQQRLEGPHYYFPSARVKLSPAKDDIECAFLLLNGAHFPSGLQAGITHEIMKNEKVVLVATEYCNVSRFKFQSEHLEVGIEMNYEGQTTKLRIENGSGDITSAVEACKKVLLACNNCLQNTMSANDKWYILAIPCNRATDAYHRFDFGQQDYSELCDACSTTNPTNNFRLCWSKAAKVYNN